MVMFVYEWLFMISLLSRSLPLSTLYFCYVMVREHLNTPATLHIRHVSEAKDNINDRMRHGPALNQLHWIVIRFDCQVNIRAILSSSLQFSAMIYPTYSHLYITNARATTPHLSAFHLHAYFIPPLVCSIPTYAVHADGGS